MLIINPLFLRSVALESMPSEVGIFSILRRVHPCVVIVLLHVFMGWPIVLVSIPLIALLRWSIVETWSSSVPIEWWVNLRRVILLPPWWCEVERQYQGSGGVCHCSDSLYLVAHARDAPSVVEVGQPRAEVDLGWVVQLPLQRAAG